MRRSLCFTMLAGILFAMVPAGQAAGADGACDGGFSARLRCWYDWLGRGAVTVRLNRALSLDAAGDRADRVGAVLGRRENLVVEVPAGVTTGEGGTVLLVLAGHRFVDPEARISRLTPVTVQELNGRHVCDPGDIHDLCALLGRREMTGRELTARSDVAVLGAEHSVAIGSAASHPPASSAAREKTKGASGQSGTDPATILVAVMAVLLVLLLAALVYVVRRSRPLAAPHAGALPASSGRAAETTTRLRTTPAAAPGRSPASRKGPSRSAVVRTDLHPQGYVELDRVLYRAVWAQPGQPPPGPGARVDVTEAPEPDSDVLYAFPPATGRQTHAR
ncbi:hypothetical protein [Streptomyces sp. NBC_00453]|uniref:hypothetical protein n=2 Tax=Streptomyces TaxID=1883 RepID=UPI002E2201C7